MAQCVFGTFLIAILINELCCVTVPGNIASQGHFRHKDGIRPSTKLEHHNLKSFPEREYKKPDYHFVQSVLDDEGNDVGSKSSDLGKFTTSRTTGRGNKGSSVPINAFSGHKRDFKEEPPVWSRTTAALPTNRNGISGNPSAEDWNNKIPDNVDKAEFPYPRVNETQIQNENDTALKNIFEIVPETERSQCPVGSKWINRRCRYVVSN